MVHLFLPAYPPSLLPLLYPSLLRGQINSKHRLTAGAVATVSINSDGAAQS